MDKQRLKANDGTDTMRKKQVLVTITPYKEQEKRVLNGTSNSATVTTTTLTTMTTATVTGAPVPPPAPPPLPFSPKSRGNDDSVEMQSIESFKLKETPNTVPKPPPTYFPNPTVVSNGSPRHTSAGNKPQIANGKDAATSPVTEFAKISSSSVSPINGTQPSKPIAGGKVAIRIGAYEGETKQPSKLDFLSQQTRQKNGADDASSNSPVVSRLQNELAATLQRSNLRKKTEGENQSPMKAAPENTVTLNDTTNSEPGKLPQNNVEKLASTLNKVTIKVNPESSSR